MLVCPQLLKFGFTSLLRLVVINNVYIKIRSKLKMIATFLHLLAVGDVPNHPYYARR
jgi:hypothetical protein